MYRLYAWKRVAPKKVRVTKDARKGILMVNSIAVMAQQDKLTRLRT
jgi:hypothetical protein